jgi:hypothetical protein
VSQKNGVNPLLYSLGSVLFGIKFWGHKNKFPLLNCTTYRLGILSKTCVSIGRPSTQLYIRNWLGGHRVGDSESVTYG